MGIVQKIRELKLPIISILILAAFYFITMVLTAMSFFTQYENAPYEIFNSIRSFQMVLWAAFAIIIIYGGYVGSNKPKKLGDAAISGAILGVELGLAFSVSVGIINNSLDFISPVVYIGSIGIIGILLSIVGGLKAKLK